MLVIGLGGLGCLSPCIWWRQELGTSDFGGYDEVELDQFAAANRSYLEGDVKGRKFIPPNKRCWRLIPASINVVSALLRSSKVNNKHKLPIGDLVLDCTDNFSIRYAINAAGVRQQKPLMSGAAIRLKDSWRYSDARDAQSPLLPMSLSRR